MTRRLEVGLLERLAVQAGITGSVELFRRDRLDQAGDGGRGRGINLNVERAQLDGADLRMRTDVPPDVRVVIDTGGSDQLVRDLAEVLVVAELTRQLKARVAAHDLRAGAVVTGVLALLEWRVCAESLEHGQVEAECVGDPHRGLGVWHPDVHMEAARRRSQEAGQIGPHRLIARLRDKGRLPLLGGGMKAASRSVQSRRP